MRPRSLVPVALASAIAAVLRVYWLGPGPLFVASAGPGTQDGSTMLTAVEIGLLVGVASAALSRTMYSFEDLFRHLPVHWMWWPAIGGVGIGVGVIFFPRGLGVGHDNIAQLLQGNAPMALLLGLILAKSLMWAFSLGSGTSGGVLAPLLMIGGALGELMAVGRPCIGPGSVALGCDWHGRDAIRFARRSADRNRLQPGTNALSSRAPALDARLHRVPCSHLADHAAVDPHRKTKPPGLSPDARVRCGSLGDGKCDGSHVSTSRTMQGRRYSAARKPVAPEPFTGDWFA